MKKLHFEDKGSWVTLELDGGNVSYSSQRSNHKDWSKEALTFYSRTLLDHLKEVHSNLDDNKKLELFFEAKGFAKKDRLYKELFRMDWSYTAEQWSYIYTTIEQAENFFGYELVLNLPALNNKEKVQHTMADLDAALNSQNNKNNKEVIQESLFKKHQLGTILSASQVTAS